MEGLGYDPGALTLLPEVEVRRALAAQTLRFRVLSPPFAALGIGKLRVLRIAQDDAWTEIVAGYERYERLPEA